MREVNRYLWRLTKWTGLALVIFVSLSMVANAQTDTDRVFDQFGQDAGMDSDQRNPGNDKIRCLKYEDCPDWDGNPDTKVYFDLMKLDNGSGIIAKSDFNWQVHLYSCHLNEMLDSINGEGSFEKRAIASAKAGMVPCPIGVNPHWSYDWELHILKAKLKKLTMLWPKDLGQMGRQLAGPQNSINMVE